jgi:hypothetical protein
VQLEQASLRRLLLGDLPPTEALRRGRLESGSYPSFKTKKTKELISIMIILNGDFVLI